MWTKFNINNRIKIKPKGRGLNAIPVYMDTDKDGYVEMQMWEFIAIFGNITSLAPTMNKLFENNILIKSEDKDNDTRT